jgi:hypothetical protein
MKSIVCNKCGIVFEKISTRYMCKDCNKEYNIKNKKHIKEYNKNRYENNRSEIINKIKTYHFNNKEKIKEYTKIWFKDNKHHINEYNRKKYNSNIEFKIKLSLRNSLLKKLKYKNTEKIISSLDLLGCSVQDFKLHLEKQFLPEMNWENHGDIWEIDHIKPCASFNLIDINQQKECFHYTNMQPLFKTTEIAKSFGYKNYIGNRNKNKF